MQVPLKPPAFLLAAMLLAAAPPSALADPFGQDEMDWLKTMALAAYQTDYIGTFVYQFGNHVETSRITHVVDSDGEHGRLESLDGSRRVFIHNNTQVWCYLGDRKVSVENRQGRRKFPALLPQQFSLLSENYQISKAEEVRVAGLLARVFVFQPEDNLRYTHKMWAHSDSGLLLKAAVLDERGRVIEQYAFTHLTIGGNIDRTWIIPNKSVTPLRAQHPVFAHLSKTDEAASASGWQVDSLPAGFIKTMEIRRPLSGRKASVTQMAFSDGLAGISVFIEAMAGNSDAKIGLSSLGAMQIYSKVSGDYLLTVVGEVPPRTVMQIADSVRYKGQ